MEGLVLAVFLIVLYFYFDKVTKGWFKTDSIEVDSRGKPKIPLSWVKKFILVIGIVLFINECIVIIQPGTVGVKIFFGSVLKVPLKSGINPINPLLTIVRMNVRTEEYTMSSIRDEGAVVGDDAIESLTSEGLKVKLDLTCWYHLDPNSAPQVYENLGTEYVTKIVRPALRTAIRDVIAKYSSAMVYSEKRANITLEIEESVRKLIDNRGIIFEKILLRNVILPQRLQDAIDAKLAAEQEAEKMEFILKKEEKERDRKMIEAEGIRKANSIIAQGLTGQYIQWYRIEMMKQLVNSPNNTVIFIPEDMKTTPIINLPQSSKK